MITWNFSPRITWLNFIKKKLFKIAYEFSIWTMIAINYNKEIFIKYFSINKNVANRLV